MATEIQREESVGGRKGVAHHKGKQKAKPVPVRPDERKKKRRQVDTTKLVAVFILTVVIVLTLWIFNPDRFLAVMIAFVVGTLYGIALPHMAQRTIH